MLHLEEHRKELSGAKVYTCKTCSKEFKMAGQLKEHTKTHIKMRLESEGTVAEGLGLIDTFVQSACLATHYYVY